MTGPQPDVVVAGHICLDIIPTFAARAGGFEDFLRPGGLVQVGPPVLATGGAVSNTGLSLHRLGIPTRLMGKVGDDLFGDAILRLLRASGPALADGMIVARGESSSYSIVINPPGIDRSFLHSPGANDTFCAADIPYAELAGLRLFHFGYPPLMRRFYENNGDELIALFRNVRAIGATTSLDLAMPDPATTAGRVDWRALLSQILPYVDVFAPSIDEMRVILGGQWADAAASRDDVQPIRSLAGELLRLGAAIIGLKLGDRGLYVRTTGDADRLAVLRPAVRGSLDTWRNRELLAPCFEVSVAGTTGCGDATIAGFLAGMLHGLPLDDTLTAAVAVGACCAERPDATSGVPHWDLVQARLRRGWKQLAPRGAWAAWQPDCSGLLRRGPQDRQ